MDYPCDLQASINYLYTMDRDNYKTECAIKKRLFKKFIYDILLLLNSLTYTCFNLDEHFIKHRPLLKDPPCSSDLTPSDQI